MEDSRDLPDDAVDELRLAMVAGIGPRLRKALLDRFGSAANIFRAAPSDLRDVPGIGPELTRRLVGALDQTDVLAQIALCREHGIQIVGDRSSNYPHMLREICDPPGILFVRGELRPQDNLGIAIVGSRHGTQYGLAQAERLAASLARAGLTIVSGLARGVDAAAHRGALAAGGRTLAVLGSGILNLYPPEHAELAVQVAAQGAILSESPPHSPPLSGAFPQRNRIISGLSLGVIIVEAALQSGALITARLALEQGREVFAVPGRVDNRMSRGCHRLIRDGAKLVESADDVLEELGPLVTPTASADGQTVHHPAELLLNECERQVLSAISSERITVDEVVRNTGLPVPQVLATLSVLEMRRLVRRPGGNSVQRAH